MAKEEGRSRPGWALWLGRPGYVLGVVAPLVASVELLPVQAIVQDRELQARRLRNYWGYNTLGFFCPSPRFATRPEEIGRAHV